MDAHFPGQGWLRLDRDTLAALARYRSAHMHTELGGDGDGTARRRDGGGRMTELTRSAGSARWPTPCCTRDTCSTRTAATSAKNQVRWQFGVLGPPGAAAAGVGEEPDLAVQCLLAAGRAA